jgi:hypothetical protein
LQPAGRKYPDKNKYPINHIGYTWPVWKELETLYQLLTGVRPEAHTSKLATFYKIFWALVFPAPVSSRQTQL